MWGVELAKKQTVCGKSKKLSILYIATFQQKYCEEVKKDKGLDVEMQFCAPGNKIKVPFI